MLRKISRRNVFIFFLSTIFIVSSAVRAAGAEAPVFIERFIFDETPGYPSCHGSTVAELPGGDLLAAWYAGAAEKAKDVAILYSRLKKGADVWTRPAVLHDNPGRSEGNPVLFAAPDGTAWLFYQTMYGGTWNDCKIHARVSTDNGRTWGRERTIREKTGWMTRNKPIVISDGRWLLPCYDETIYISTFYITDDNGATWKEWGRIMPFGNHQPAVIERADGVLYAMMRTGVSPKGRIWEAVSKNKGRTWTRARLTGIPNPDSGIDMVRLPNGNLVLAFNPSFTSRTPLSAALSPDEGRSWLSMRDILAGEGEFSYPAVIAAADGMIHVTFTYKRTHIKHVAFNEAWLREGGTDRLRKFERAEVK